MEWSRLQLVRRSNRDRFEELFTNVALVLERLRASIRESDVELLVMIIPDEYQIDSSLRGQVLEHYGASEDELDLDLPQRRLRDYLDAAGIRYLDLLPAFRQTGERLRLYKARDSHWSIAGNDLAAEHLHQYLADSHWPP